MSARGYNVKACIRRVLRCLGKRVRLSIAVVRLSSSRSRLGRVRISNLGCLGVPLECGKLCHSDKICCEAITCLLYAVVSSSGVGVFRFGCLRRCSVTCGVGRLYPGTVV